MNKFLEKIAEKLRPHQEEALKKLDEEGGLIANHSLGSGKTRLALEAISRAQKKDKTGRALMVAPASLITNIDSEIKKFGVPIDRSRLDVRTYEKATRDADTLKKNKYIISVSDESHKMRNAGTLRSKELSEIFSNSDKRLLLTGTMMYNNPSDMSALINIAAGGKILPTHKKDFEDRFLKTDKIKPTLIQRITRQDPGEKVSLKNHKELSHVLNKYVHTYNTEDDPSSKGMFPTSTETFNEIEMSKEQERLYKYVEGDLPFLIRAKIRHGLPLDKKEKASLNAFSVGVRQVSSGIRHLHKNPDDAPYTPKIEAMHASLKEGLKNDKNFRGMAYSSFLGAGVDELSRKLTEDGIDHGVYTGKLSAAEKDRLVQEYNEGKKKILLVSGAGSEGLNLRGTKKILIDGSHFNRSKTKQVVGRGIRYQSHMHLPENEREVKIEHYHSVLPKRGFGMGKNLSIDQYLHQNGEDKEEVFGQIKGLLKKND